jgi:uncharacterized protein (TIGR03435 family)
VAQTAQDIAGTWQGTIQAGKGARIVLKVAKGEGVAEWRGVVYNLDSDLAYEGRATDSMNLQGRVLRFTVVSIEAGYEGKLSVDGASFFGNWTQGGQAHALDLARVNEATAWEIPKADLVMAKDADPDWEVATVRPSDPNARNNTFDVRGRHVVIENQPVEMMLMMAFGVQKSQVVDVPDWVRTERFDVVGMPDVEGKPNLRQFQSLVRKLLTERFGLKTHTEQREMPVFALRVAKGGTKIAKSTGDPNGLPREDGEGGNIPTCRFANTSMADLALYLLLDVDRPVVDQTGLQERYDFQLKWSKAEVTTADPNAPPGLFTAIQEQIGLKLVPVKARTDVLVVDHVERPSAN